MRAASWQPLPDVVTPIWSGPEVCVLRSVKVQRCGVSSVLSGMRRGAQRAAMCGPGGVLVSAGCGGGKEAYQA